MTIPFDVKESVHVELAVCNALRQRVRTVVDGEYEPGRHRVAFDGGELASGVYFCVIQMGEYRAGKKMLVLK